MSATFDRGGTALITASQDGIVRIADARTGTVVRTFLAGGGLRGAAISADTSALVATVGDDGNVGIWDATSGERLTTFRSGAPVVDGVFAPDGPRLLTASLDHRAIVWDLDSESQGPTVVAAFLSCRVPYRLRETRLEVVAPTPCAR